ncbi:hypothetical protein E2C01_001688 [Portunus trituberculatus]|uniref:Uncharacterized protein n=1 Tax=Portunus trituberculatus TaxID=210409 RepID=A0A5B7CIJ7_PORTR|nr:hypothetical protein [Portunus trituberculatus]
MQRIEARRHGAAPQRAGLAPTMARSGTLANITAIHLSKTNTKAFKKLSVGKSLDPSQQGSEPNSPLPCTALGVKTEHPS